MRSLRVLFGAVLATALAATGYFITRNSDEQPVSTAHVMDRRCRGGCTDTALLRVLPTVPQSAIAAGTLTTSNGLPITFTRSSVKTCVQSSGSLVSLAANTPCVETTGLLAENSIFNQVPFSEQFDNVAWQKTAGVTVTANACTSPRGDATADQVDFIASAGANVTIYQAPGYGSGAYTHSFYVKGVTTGGTLYMPTLDVTPNTWTSTTCTYTSTSWTRCSRTLSSINGGAGGQVYFMIGRDTRASNPDISAQSVCLWGDQHENNDHMTSYIGPTAGAAVSRASESAAIAPGAIPKQTPSWCISALVTPENGHAWTSITGNIIAIGAATVADTAQLGITTAGNVTLTVKDAAGNTKTGTAAHTFVAGSTHRLTGCSVNGTLTVSFDGVAKTTTPSGTGTGVLGEYLTSYYVIEPNGGVPDVWMSDYCFGVGGQCSGVGGAVAVVPTAFMGDSITGSSGLIHYPERVQSMGGTNFIATYNYGVAGYIASQILNAWETLARPRSPSQVVVLGGVNDMIAGSTAAATWASLQTLADEAIADGKTVHLVNVLPFGNNAGWSAGKQTQLVALNASITAYCTAHSLTCVDGYTLMGDTDPTKLKAAYDSGDGLHPNDTGLAVLAGAVNGVLP